MTLHPTQRRLVGLLFFVALAIHLLKGSPASAQDETPPPQNEPPNAAQIIEAVNNLRLSHGLNPLMVHPVLMQVAQSQSDGIAGGLGGHWRPNGLSLGQWLISLGYPLSGDLKLDGYRSENWGFAQTAEIAVAMWLGDDEHSNTMLSSFRSDMGVGISYSAADEAYVIVIETALQTKSGLPQTEAFEILTAIPATQAAYSGMATQAAKDGLLPQGMMPIAVSTPLADGNVYHEVQYGQTLWSIAISYGTTVKQIQQLNNLLDTIVQPGQKLLVLKGVTQTASASSSGATASPPQTLPTQTATPSATPTLKPARVLTEQEKRQNTFGIVGIGISALFLGGLFTAMTKRKPI